MIVIEKERDVTPEEALDIAQELDGMDREVSSWEADFLSSVLPRLRDGRGLSEKQEAVLLKMEEKYLKGEDERPPIDSEDA